ncbi:MAG: hypothetical protein KF745_00010 [Phycisphaeraceae bacterium]|nr:hypothetical protein [Phycisphaeraceae bacterium]
MQAKNLLPALLSISAVCGVAVADVQVSNYDDLPEGFLGSAFDYNGVQYRDVNGVGGVFPDGSTFVPADIGNDFIIENAGLLYGDFPGWGSPSNCLTFGTSYIGGENLSLGAFATAWMDLPQVSDSISFDMVFYENGPWGGIVFHLDAYLNGNVVGTDSFTISDLGGRDNIAFSTLSVSGVQFDSAHIYATFGASLSAPRLMIDDLTINTVPAPASAGVLAAMALGLRRRRR